MSDHDVFPSLIEADERLAALRARFEHSETAPLAVDLTTALGQIQGILKTAHTRYGLMCQILDRTEVAAFAKDLDGRYVMITPSGAAMFGRAVADIVGANDTALFDPADAQRMALADREVLSTQATHTLEETFTLQGLPTRVLTTRTAWYDNQGTLRGLIGTFRQQTEHGHTANDRALQRDRLRSMASGILITEERQRRALAAHLHDGIGQDIALVRMKLSAVRLAAGAGLHELLSGIEELVERADRSVRSVTFQLSPPPLYDFGLLPALEWLAEDLGGRHGIKVTVEDDGSPAISDEGLRVILFRAVREILVDAATHGGALEANVRLQRAGSGIQVIVTDAGIGFDTAALHSRSQTLFEAHEILEHAGGQVHVESSPRRTTVTLTSSLGFQTPAGGRRA